VRDAENKTGHEERQKETTNAQKKDTRVFSRPSISAAENECPGGGHISHPWEMDANRPEKKKRKRKKRERERDVEERSDGSPHPSLQQAKKNFSRLQFF
jgi:hypothetical protein